MQFFLVFTTSGRKNRKNFYVGPDGVESEIFLFPTFPSSRWVTLSLYILDARHGMLLKQGLDWPIHIA